MEPPNGPIEVFKSAIQGTTSRVICCFAVCSLGSGLGEALQRPNAWRRSWFWENVGESMGIVGPMVTALFTSYGFVVYPLCILFAFAFVRFEWSFWWLLVPFFLVAIQVSILTLRF